MPQALGTRATLGLQYEATYGVKPSADTPVITADLTKVYFESEGFKSSRNLVSSNVLTGSRQATAPIQGNIDVQGSIATELQAYIAMLLYGAAGSIATTANAGTGEVTGSALATPAAVIDATNQKMTVTVTTHGLLVGDVVLVAGLTAPTTLNGLYLRVIKVPDANSFVCRIPKDISTTFTIGSGTIKKVTTPATTYQHLLKFGGVLPSFTVEKGFPDIAQYFVYSGAKISKLGLNVTPEGFQKISFDFSGKSESVSGTSYDNTLTDLGKSSFSGFNIASIIEDVGGANNTLATVTKLDINIENNLDTGIYTVGGAGSRGALPEGLCKCTGTMECLFQDVTLYNKAINSTESSLKVLYQVGTGAGTTGNESIEILIPELIFKQEAPVVSGDKGVMVSLPFEAYYSNSAQASVAQITLKSAQLPV